MGLRRRSIRLRIILLVAIPILSRAGLSAFTAVRHTTMNDPAISSPGREHQRGST